MLLVLPSCLGDFELKLLSNDPINLKEQQGRSCLGERSGFYYLLLIVLPGFHFEKTKIFNDYFLQYIFHVMRKKRIRRPLVLMCTPATVPILLRNYFNEYIYVILFTIRPVKPNKCSIKLVK